MVKLSTTKKTLLAGLATTGAATFLTQTDASADTYEVKAGDTLSEIAEAKGTTVDQLVQLNNISDANFILTGTTLNVDEVPVSSVAEVETPAASSVAPVTSAVADDTVTAYTVQAGDTLYAISQKFGVTLANLVTLNGLTDTELVSVGQVIQLRSDVTVASDFAVGFISDSATVEEPAADTYEVASAAPASSVAPASAAPANTQSTQTVATSPVTGSVYDQFIAAGGTDALWVNIVLPESGGNPDAQSPAGYHGLGQTLQSWGWGSVAEQTAGMLNYAINRYGSIDNAISFRLSHGWW